MSDIEFPVQTWSSKRLFIGLALLASIVCVGLLLVQTSAAWGDVFSFLPAPIASLALHLVEKTKHATILSPYFYLGMSCLFVAERFIPARERQGVFSPGMLQDVVWFLVNTLPLTTLTFMYAALLGSLYKQHLGFLTVDAITMWPEATRIVMAMLVGDLLGWGHHFIRHKVEVFWYFHTIHHSQRQMNMFTDHRIHLAEFLITDTLVFLPSQMFQLSTVSLGYFLIFIRWYTRMYHSNLRTNFGPLKYVLVTPQSHRVHHSIEKRHVDKNFGTLFTIWDRMFGTLYNNYEEYPDTGVKDERFPLNVDAKRFRGLATYWAQTMYPFRVIYERMTARRHRDRDSQQLSF